MPTTLAATAVAREIRVRLRRWYAALRSLGSLQSFHSVRQALCDDSCELALWKIESHPTTAAAASYLRAAEGVALLNLLARLDLREFVDEVVEVWTFVKAIEDVEQFVGKNVAIAVQLNVVSNHSLAAISERIIGVDAPSCAFQETYALAKRVLQETGTSDVSEPIPLVLSVSLISLSCSDWDFVLRQILQLTVTQSSLLSGGASLAKWSRPRPTTVRFRIVDVDFVSKGQAVITLKSLDYLRQIAELGVRINNLLECDLGAHSDNAQQIVNAVRVLIPSYTGSGCSSAGIEGIEVGEDATLRAHQALFSAIQVNKTVERVKITMHPEARISQNRDAQVSFWRWIAYALFSRHADHNVKELSISGSDLSEDDVIAMREVLLAQNPADAVIGMGHLRTEKILASRFYLNRPDEWRHDETNSFWESDEPLQIRAIERPDGMWWRVILPGWGQAWVHTFDAMPSNEQAAVTESVGSTIRSVSLDVSEVNEEETLLLLQLVSRGLKNLEITEAFGIFNADRWCSQVLRLCPDLESLVLREASNITDLNIFVEAARTGYFRLRLLSVEADPDELSLGVKSFFEALTDREHQIARCLQELFLVLWIPEEEEQDIILLLTRVLQFNRRLHTLTIYFVGSGPDRIIVPIDDVVIRTAPLALRSKLAFLSVVYGHQFTQISERVDSGILSSIFQLAAESQARKVEFRAA